MARLLTRRRVLGLAVAASVAAALFVAWMMSADRGHAPSAPQGVDRAATAGPPFKDSLTGTTPFGGAQVSANDSLVLEPGLLRLFEYYLSTEGEHPLAAIRAQIESDLDGRLGPNAAHQAKDLLGRYLGYRQTLKDAAAAGVANAVASAASNPAVDRLRAALNGVQAARARYFTPAESAALFGPDDAAAQAALDRLAAAQDPTASPAERQRRLDALDAASPGYTQAREASNLINRMNDETQRILAAGGSEDDVYRMRAAAVSTEAANRLADLDRDEAQWKSRISDYLQQRSTLLAAPGTHADADLSQLRMRLFTPDEQRRLPAYEP